MEYTTLYLDTEEETCRRTMHPEDKVIFFRKKRNIYPISVKDIVYLSKENRITRVYLADGEIMEIPYVRYSKLLEQEDIGLFMCNRNTIVNREYVYALDLTNCFVVLKDELGMLDIGLKYRSEIKEEFANKHKKCDESDKVFVIRRHNVYYPVKVLDLMYVKYFERTLHLYMKTGHVLLLEQHPLHMILELAKTRYLMQCNRSELVNLLFVDKLDVKKKEILLKNGEKLKIGGTYKKQIKEVWEELYQLEE